MDVKNNGMTYCLNKETIDIINNIASLVGAADYVKTPNFPRREKRRPKNSEIINADDWEHIRQFKATELKKKIGEDKVIDEIRQILIKLTNKTYDECKVDIISKIENLLESDESIDFEKIGSAIFKEASSNRFSSVLYAQLYKALMDKFEFMYTIFYNNYEKVAAIFDNIEISVDSDNYDKLCEINKVNDNRRSLCEFYVNLMLCGVIAPNKLLEIIRLVKENITDLMKAEDNSRVVEEYSELLYILISKSFKHVKETSESDVVNNYKLLIDDITTISECTRGTFPSLSNKSIFRHMDIIEELEDEL